MTKTFARFAAQTTDVNVFGKGVFNGYRINEVLQQGQYINFRDCEYFYIPILEKVVSYVGSRAKVMAITNGKIGMNETVIGNNGTRGKRKINVCATSLYNACAETFN